MNYLTALTILPQEQIALAYSHETIELKRYRWLALTFLPFDPSISRLMGAMSTESALRLDDLRDRARKMEIGACVNTNSLEEVAFFPTQSQHFFIVNERMGHQVLIKAEEAAKTSHSFFDLLLETNATPELHSTLFNFVVQKNNEYHVLKECREQWNMSFAKRCLAM